jgi:Flagellar biosynthesis regulator FlaF
MEYRLFGQVTRALMHAATLDKSDVAGRMDAWTGTAACGRRWRRPARTPDNAMPQAMRAQFIP